MIHYLTEALGLLDKKFVLASELESREGSTERLIDICKQLEGDVYLSGKDGAKYMDAELFEEEGIQVIFQDYHHPRYNQLYGGFEPFLSVIDLLFNCGPERSSSIYAPRQAPNPPVWRRFQTVEIPCSVRIFPY